MAFVLDASVALAWYFVEEGWEQAEALGLCALNEGITVPSLFGIEVTTALLRGERDGRTPRADVATFISRLQMLRMDVVESRDPFSVLLPLAREVSLKVADTAYLDVALMRGLPIATFDSALRRAAGQVGVPVLES